MHRQDPVVGPQGGDQAHRHGLLPDAREPLRHLPAAQQRQHPLLDDAGQHQRPVQRARLVGRQRPRSSAGDGHAQVTHSSRSCSTAFSTSARSVMIPSTPRSSSVAHLVGVVDRPHVDLQAAVVGGRDDPLGDQRHRAPSHRHLHAGGAERARRAGPGWRARNRATWRGPIDVHDRGPEALAHPGQAAVGEGADAHPVDRARALDQVDQRLDGGVVLGIDVDAHVGPRPSAGPRAAGSARGRRTSASRTVVVGQVAEHAGAVGEPVEVVVVEGDEHPVAGGVGVGLEVAVARGRRRPRTPPSCSRPGRRASGRPGGRRRAGRASRGTAEAPAGR